VRAANVAAIDAATAQRLLNQYRPLLKRAGSRYPWLDQHELQAVWEDAVCEAFLSHARERAAEETWVKRVFRWRLTDFIKRAHETPSVVGAPLGVDPKVVNGINPELAFWEAAAMEELLRLPPRQQTIVVAYLHGYTYAEVADQVGIPLSTAYKEYRDAIDELRKRVVLGGSKDGT
jgi:RNA polymerase sigma factor (sigma-70 family)